MKKIIVLDGYNLIYRARYSGPKWQKGNNFITYRFFRSLRPIIEKLNPDKVYFVLEGYPKMRMEKSPDYKGTRVREKDLEFSNQKKEIIEILENYFPIQVIRHPDYECDDIVGHIVCKWHAGDECVVVSTDTDFLQLYNTHKNFKLYNPIRKDFTDHPGCDYVVWKSLKGDSADNITGFKGVGDKTALSLTNDSAKLKEFLDRDIKNKEKFNHNKFMIKFHEDIKDLNLLEISSTESNWEEVESKFKAMEFSSIIKEKSWNKFKQTFLELESK